MKHLKVLLRKKGSMLILCASVIIGSFLVQTAQAETTYVITDGSQVITHTTSATDPKKVIREAGFILHTDDTFETQTTEAGSEIIISRAAHVTLCLEGTEMELLGQGETVEELLNRSGIRMEEHSILSVSRDTPVYDGMRISLDRVQESREQYTVELPFDTTYTYDQELPKGQQRILQAGQPGQAIRTADVVYVNAQERERKLLEETVVKQPVNERIVVGTGEDLGKPVIGDGKIQLPSGEVLTYYRTDQYVATAYTKTDAGCDDITANGTPVHVGVVAVDPTVIPYGTRMFIVTNDGTYIYGLGTAEDCGGAIQGKRLDLYMDTTEECFQFGVKDCTVYFLGDADWRIY